MTAQLTLVEFLTARLDEDEAAVQAMARPVTEPQLIAHRPLQTWMREHPSLEVREVARRVLAEVDAKRRIVELWRDANDRAAGWDVDPGDPDGAPDIREANALLDVLRLLVLPYADHPDYDEAWRP